MISNQDLKCPGIDWEASIALKINFNYSPVTQMGKHDKKQKSTPGSIFNYISEEGLETLHDYKYVSGGYSPLEDFLMPFFNWVVTLIPMVSL